MKIKDFEPKVISINDKNTDVNILYPITGQNENRNSEIKEAAHPDFVTALQNFKESLLLTYRYDEDNLNVIKKKVTVIKISHSGNEKNSGIIISGKLETENKAKVAMNSPRITFKKTDFGFEQECEDLWNNLVTEAYEYLFKGKRKQLSADFDQEQPEETKTDETKGQKKEKETII